jgi:hypothetical protein
MIGTTDLNLPSITRTIGEHEYKATILPLIQWYPLEGLCTEAFGGPLEELLGSIPLNAVDLEEGRLALSSLDSDFVESLAKVIGGLLRGLGPEKLRALVESMTGSVEVRVPGQNFETFTEASIHEWFRRYMGELLPVILLHLEAQFKDFFGGALSLLSGLTLEKDSKSGSKMGSKRRRKSRSPKG